MKIFTLLFCVFGLFFANSSLAASLIRDDEAETTIRKIAEPIFKVANLNSSDIKIFIVNDDQINAYVMGGQNIFINTGLIKVCKDPEMLMGVIAHETGHISGGHLVQNTGEMDKAYLKSMTGFMLGLAAAAAGSPEVGQAVILGSNQIATRQLLQHTRIQEDSADQAALTYLDKLGYSSSGLDKLLRILYNKQVKEYSNLNPYTLTHPLSQERINHLENYIKKFNSQPVPLPVTIRDSYGRIYAKFVSFLDSPEDTFRSYPSKDTSVNARYARAIAYYKQPNLNKFSSEVDALLLMYPNDPYFYELKGQAFFENGKIDEALKAYYKASELLPKSALIKIELASAQISSDRPELMKNAVSNLKFALNVEKNNSFAWRSLGIAYGKIGDLGMSNLALAEESAINGDKLQAKEFIKSAKKYLKPGDAGYIRLSDLEKELEKKK